MKRQGIVRALRVILPLVLLFTLGCFASTAQGDPGSCPWQRGDLHKMHWGQPPDEGFTGANVSVSQTVLADDFQCTTTGPVRSIHLWGAFLGDLLPTKGAGSLTFELSIHANGPGSTGTWSRPGEVLWSQVFTPGEYTTQKVHDGPQDWYEPISCRYLSANHRSTYQYDFCVKWEPFVAETGTIYWLAVKELSASTSYTFGCKTAARQFRWNDAAVYVHPSDGGWFKTTYPQGHKYANEPLDLAFVIADGDESLPQYDLGDAPDSSNNVPGAVMIAYADGTTASFPTAYQAGSPPFGPVHGYPRDRFYLGRWVSLEREADIGVDEDSVNNLRAQSSLANRDGGDDGLQLPVVMPSYQQTTLKYTVSVTSPGTQQAYVNIWCDWNRDGDWNDKIPTSDGSDIPEWAVQNQQPVLCGPGIFTITTPAFRCWHPAGGAIGPMWLRITLSEQPWDAQACDDPCRGGAGPEGGYMYGETEDYYIQPLTTSVPVQYDWGDAFDSPAVRGYPTLSVHEGARHVIAGPWLGDDNGQPDAEANGQPHLKALSDNNVGRNDEQGVAIQPLVQGQRAAATIQVNGGGGVVQAWIDFDDDGVWQDDEGICDGFLPEGIHTIPFTVPDTAATGWAIARFRISRSGGLSPFGLAPDGEVEDHQVWIDRQLDAKSWCQWPDGTPDGISIRVDSSDGKRRAMADDFECSMPGRLTQVRLWGSWKDDRRGAIVRIRLRIHPDDPAGSVGQDKMNCYSKPAPEILWEEEYVTDQFEETPYHVAFIGGLWWRDLVSCESNPGRGSRIWQIDIPIDPNHAFLQEGLPTAPKIYWLAAELETVNGQFGWSTRLWPEHFADDAVSGTGAKLPLAWQETFYPHGHAYYDIERNSVDMAFCLLFHAESFARVTCEPTVATQCPTVETSCPAIATRCPVMQTQCPSDEVTCPVITQYPVMETLCPVVETQCRMIQTQCPAIETLCPALETQCPMWPTQCPPSLTSCPLAMTTCQAAQTMCPVVQTVCPPVVTQCQTIQSMCPAVQTFCPPTDTTCPLTVTQCPPMSTCCPHAQMQVPSQMIEVERLMASTGAACPIVEAACLTVGESAAPRRISK